MIELKNKRILIADDEEELLKVIVNALTAEGFFNLYAAKNCSEALEIVKRQRIALCVLDINLPDGDGFSLFENIKEISVMPVIFLTARGEAADRIRGLEQGADDYIVKPFYMKELVLRITAILRRTYALGEIDKKFKLSDRIVDLENASITCEQKNISLTAKELVLLKKLYENKNKIVTNDSLCEVAWGDGYYGYENTLMVHIRRLRKKVEKYPSKPSHLITVRGIGYKLVIDDE